METNRISPWGLLVNFGKSWSAEEAAWLIITIGLVFALHKLAVMKKREYDTSWKDVVLFAIAIIGWIFAMYMVMLDKISKGGILSYIFMVISAISIFIVIFILFNHNMTAELKLSWRRILSGIITAVIVFSMIAFMGMNMQYFALALVMGSILGFSAGLLIINVVDMMKNPGKAIEPEPDREDKPAPKKKWTPPPV